MKRDYIDFDRIDVAHQAMDLRLQNWARWLVPRGRGFVSPMFRMFRSTEQWQQAAAINPVDSLQAVDTEKAVQKLPEKHRDATRWQYVYSSPMVHRPVSVGQACRALAVSRGGLFELVREARVMLINRG